MKIHIQNGRLIDPANRLDAQHDLFIADGKIVGVGRPPTASRRAHDRRQRPRRRPGPHRPRRPPARARLRIQGHPRIRDGRGHGRRRHQPGHPPDTDPVLDEPGLVEMLCYRAKKLNRAHVYPVGALTIGLKGEQLSEMAELVEAGCVAFSQANTPILDTRVLGRAMQYAATFGFRVWLQPIDPHLARGGVAHDGEVASRLGLPGIPASAEIIALFTYLRLARLTGARLHITRLSSADSLALIDQARADGVDVTCDVAAHHLHLCDMDIGYFNPHCHVIPPLRSQRDRIALARAVAEGRINAICSDHTPVDDDAKQAPSANPSPAPPASSCCSRSPSSGPPSTSCR
jgi:dihydroorotase